MINKLAKMCFKTLTKIIAITDDIEGLNELHKNIKLIEFLASSREQELKGILTIPSVRVRKI